MNKDKYTDELVQALEELVKLHQNWYRGNAYVPVSFERKNDLAIANAQMILSQVKGDTNG